VIEASRMDRLRFAHPTGLHSHAGAWEQANSGGGARRMFKAGTGLPLPSGQARRFV